MTVSSGEADQLTGVRPDGAIRLHSLAEGLRLSMIHLSRRLHRNDPSELSITQVSGLASVIHAGPLGVGRLAELESLPSSAATRLADKLEAAGLVVRQANPGDRRGVQVVATAAGRDLLARRAQAGNAWLAERLAALSESDQRVLERAVEVLKALAADRPGTALAAGGDPYATEELKA
jgi:DNA-binding MarR family transcriptional regulator